MIDFWDGGGTLMTRFDGTLSGTFSLLNTSSLDGEGLSLNSETFGGSAIRVSEGTDTPLAVRGFSSQNAPAVADFLSATGGQLNSIANPTITISPNVQDFLLNLRQVSNSLPPFGGTPDLEVRGVVGSGAGDAWSLGFSGGVFDTGISSSFVTLDDTTRTWDFGSGNVVTLNLNATPIPEPSTVVGLGMMGALFGWRQLRRKRRVP